MKSKEIRERFLRFFEKKNHQILPGSSLIPEDPSLLLTTAGMVQFIPIFKGELKSPFGRVATVQRCLRTTDIDEVGRTARHLTFFEMLGNFSFGDYYKKEAIRWAWEFLVKDLKLDQKKLWITVFEDDDEAFGIWQKEVKIPADRIARLGEEDNFWSMGPVGPCGPCSEVIYDRGEKYRCGPDCRIGCDCDRFIEVWNLVFMQYYRTEKGKLEDLPQKNIDTGMGLERVAAILQGKTNAFECDLLKPLVDEVASLAKVKYKQAEKSDTSLKIVADHIRAVVFMISDGILPSNEGRGYVLRRLLRRAVRHGRLLGISKLFLIDLADKVIKITKEAYPEIAEHRQFIAQIISGEEKRFVSTLRQGLSLLEGYVKEATRAGTTELSGEEAFKLYDTFGFPLELTEEIAQEKGLQVDEKRFYALMEEQREKARETWEEKEKGAAKEIYLGVFDQYGETKFVGYNQTEAKVEVKAIIVDNHVADEASVGQDVEVVLSRTPFYAEMGGQVGDRGLIEAKKGLVKVVDTAMPYSGLIVHKGKVKEGEIKVGEKVTARIDIERRESIRRNHTATHLLHWALRMIFGDHVRQSGSLVDDKRLRFDFTHPQPLEPAEMRRIERMINRKVMEDHPVKAYTTTYKFATESGAIAFFGEKYGKYVRVLEIGDFSRELCGGTHVRSTGQIGLFKLVSESSVGANLRRIEALTGLGALSHVEKEEQIISEVSLALKAGTADLAGLLERLRALVDTLRERERELTSLKAKLAGAEVDKLVEQAREIKGTKVVVAKLAGKDMDTLRLSVDQLKVRLKSAAIVLGAPFKGSANLVVALTPDLTRKGLDASEIIKGLGVIIGGGGGGRPDLAQAGGKKPERLADALKKAKEILDEIIRS